MIYPREKKKKNFETRYINNAMSAKLHTYFQKAVTKNYEAILKTQMAI